MATARKIYTTCAHCDCTLRIYLLVCRWAKMVTCMPAGMPRFLPPVEPKNLEPWPGHRAPITITQAPDEYKTGASTKEHQFKNRTGTGAQPGSTSRTPEYCERVNARARVFLPAKANQVTGNATAPNNLARKVRSKQQSNTSNQERITAAPGIPPERT